MADTELKLKIWRGDQIRAERLTAAILHIEGFSSVDPQCPLGGPDGLKDVLCEKSNWKYVAAAYFPTADQSFKKIQDKFAHDLPGVAKNSADGLVFFTNQSLTPAERKVLTDLASDAGHSQSCITLNDSGQAPNDEDLDCRLKQQNRRCRVCSAHTGRGAPLA